MGQTLSAKEAADLLGIKHGQFRIYCRAGKFETAKKLRGTIWRIDLAEIEAIVKGKKVIDFSNAYGQVYGTKD